MPCANISATYEDLKYILKRFINKDNVRNAIIKIVNGNLEIRNCLVVLQLAVLEILRSSVLETKI